jgi:hypothetical protein
LVFKPPVALRNLKRPTYDDHFQPRMGSIDVTETE